MVTLRHASARPLVAAFLAVLAAGLTGCEKKTEANSKDSRPVAAGEGALLTVPVVRAARTDLAGSLVLTAEFEPFQEVDVMAKMAGYLKSMKVDIGDHVREGQLIAVLEIPEMENDVTKAAAVIQQASAEVVSARDELRRTESAHQIAHLSYTRIQDVAKKEPGLVPQQEVDEIRSRDLVAEAQIATAKSNVNTAEQKVAVAKAEENRLKTLYRYTSITAPFSGVITKRYANVGSMIQAGTASQTQAMPLVRLSQNSLLRLVLPVPESAVPLIHVGGPLAVKVTSLNRTFPGRVARVADKIALNTRTMDTEVDVPNPQGILVPGMYAEVNLEIDRRDSVLALPLDAVDGTGTSARVYRVDGAGKIKIVPVTLGLETAQRVEVRSGIHDGDAVIIGRRAALREGQQVQTKTIDFAPESGAGVHGK